MSLAARLQPKFVSSERMEQKLYPATYSNRQIEEVLVDFCLNHFNVFNRKGPERMLLAGSLPLALALLSLINPSVSPKIFIDIIYDVRH